MIATLYNQEKSVGMKQQKKATQAKSHVGTHFSSMHHTSLKWKIVSIGILPVPDKNNSGWPSDVTYEQVLARPAPRATQRFGKIVI